MSTDGIKAMRAGGAIHIAPGLRKPDHDRILKIHGAAGSASGYKLPLTLTSCDGLRSAFGERLELDRELSVWERESRAWSAKMGDLADALDAQLINVSDRVNEAMSTRTYQRVAAAFIAAAGEGVLIADQPGLGKTIELLAGVQEANPDGEARIHLVFAPVIAVETVWPGEVEHWVGEDTVAFPLRGSRTERAAALHEILTTNHEALDVYVLANLEMARIKPVKNAKHKDEYKIENALYPELFDLVWDTIVIDESHRALIKSGKPTQLRQGVDKLRSRRRVALSGTPMRGKPHQLWGTLNWLRPDIFTSYWRWVAQYWDVFSSRYSNYNLGDFLPGAEDRLASDLRPFMLRRTKEEVLPELPRKLYAGTHLIPGDDESPLGVWLTMTPRQAARYQTFIDEGTVKLPGGWVIANGALAERTRQLQLAASEGDMDGENYVPAMPSPKFDWLVEFIEALDGERVVVSSHSTALLKLYARELDKLEIPTFLLTGETPTAVRKQQVAKFQSPDPGATVFLINTKAGGVAVTLDQADYLVMLDESTIPDDDEQVEDRIHRTSRIHQVTIYKLRMLDTAEEEVAWIAAAAESVQKYILDGSRGVEYARNVYLTHKN